MPGCSDTHSTRYRFPNPDKDRKRFDVWLQLVQNPNLIELDPKRIFTNYRVCHQHFTANDKFSNMFLVRTAIPTQNLPSATESIAKASTSTSTASVSTSILQVTGEELLNPKRNEELPLHISASIAKHFYMQQIVLDMFKPIFRKNTKSGHKIFVH